MDDSPTGQPELVLTCDHCGRTVQARSRFCNGCGKAIPRNAPKPFVDDAFLKRQRNFLIAFAVVLFYILGAHIGDGVERWTGALWWDAGLFALVVLSGLFFQDVLGPALRFDGFTWGKLGLYAALQVLLTFGVLVALAAIRSALDLEDASYMALYADSPAPLLLALLSVAVFPAVSEELAFRGVLFGQLATFTGAWSTVAVTGFLFAWVHFSFLSLFWLVPAGLFFGWMRLREGTIWYGVICHFMHNATVVLGDANGWW